MFFIFLLLSEAPVDECSLGLHNCDRNANLSCVDTRFSYKCECTTGFRKTNSLGCEGKIMRLIATVLFNVKILVCTILVSK